MKLIMVRHGETIWNQQKRLQGWQDSPLTERGQAQASQLAEQLKHMSIDALYCSELGRARETATLLSEALQLPLHSRAQLNERSFGELEGLALHEQPQWWEAYRHRYQHDQIAVPGSESASQVGRRLLALLTELAETDHQTLLLVGHGESLNILHNMLLDRPCWRQGEGVAMHCVPRLLHYKNERWRQKASV